MAQSDLCVDCQNCTPVLFEKRYIAYCQAHADPVTGDEMPCTMARMDERFCGLNAKDFIAGGELPKIVKSSIDSL